MKSVRCVVVAFVAICAFGSFRAVAQDPHPQATASSAEGADAYSFALLRKVIRLLKKQLVAANLTLTDSEATKFWPVLVLFESLPRPLPLPLGGSRFGRHERLSRRSFMVGAAVFSFAVPSY